MPVLVLSDSVQRVAHWKQVLHEAGCELVSNDGRESAIDLVVVADQRVTASDFPDSVSILSVGVEQPADHILPLDATDRELTIACKLLGKIAALRRQQTQQQTVVEQLDQLALTDPLTEIPNRRAWGRELDSLAGSSDWCVALIDLDHFKSVNQRHGFTTADRVLAQTASQLQSAIRSGDFVARLGGDEFGLILRAVCPQHAEGAVERIRTSIGVPCLISDSLTASAGYAMPNADSGPREAFEIASKMLVLAKRRGRDRSVGDRETS